MRPALLVLAAGLGRRYGRLKQVEPVGPAGEAVLDFGVHDALAVGFDDVVVVVRREIEEAIRSHFDRVWPGLPVRFVYQDVETGRPGGVGPQRSKPWGTGHAVLVAAGAFEGPFAVMNADDFYGRRAFARLAESLAAASGPEFAVVAWEVRKTLSEHGEVSRALLVSDRSGRLTRITELVGVRDRGGRIEGRSVEGAAWTLSGRERVSMNLWGFTPAVFPLLRGSFEAFVAAHVADPDAEFLLSDALNGFVESGAARVSVLPTDEEWMGVTWAEDRPRVAHRLAELAAAGLYPVPLGGALRRGG